ncbi:MAG: hypothetical protein LQ339_004944 [Xanthoria mediterranea]|nr:MAG: hypothetical protein LQ339_004944 [Xanthoria mediterranea]
MPPKRRKLTPRTPPDSSCQATIAPVRRTKNPDAQAFVFEVLIGGKSYALKAFKYYDDAEDLFGLAYHERDEAPVDHLDYYCDPFYNECRAYGKLVENHLNGEVAVRCHGYLMLSAEYDDQLDDRFPELELDWDRPSEEYEKPVASRSPLRAIVKDLVLEDNIWKPYVARKMLGDLRKMRQLGIYPMDIKPKNYTGGKLVDFSVAITLPNFIFNVKPAFQIQGYMNEDLGAFDAMMQEQKVKTRQRAFRDNATVKKLRSYKNQD